MKNWTLDDLRLECRTIADEFAAFYLKPALVGFSFTEHSLGDGFFSIHVSVDGEIVEMDFVQPFSVLSAKVAKYKRLAKKLAEKDEIERRKLASVLGVSP